VARAPLVTATALERASLWQRTSELHGPLAVVFAALLVTAASLSAARRRSRRGGPARSETA
jgi:hypothetical protein